MDLEPIKARLLIATPGPWQRDKGCNIWGPDSFPVIDWTSETVKVADIRFIAHARVDVENLVAEVEKLRDAASKAIPVLHGHGLFGAENHLRLALGMETVPT